jgi:hypothetical protein
MEAQQYTVREVQTEWLLLKLKKAQTITKLEHSFV